MTKLDHDARVFSEDRARALIELRRHERGPLVEILHALNEELGYVDDRAVPLVAEALNLSVAEVHGVLTFYRDFRREAPPEQVLRMCRAEACQSMGAERLLAHASGRLGIEVGERTADGHIGLEQVFCLGNCALAPAAMLAGRLHGRLDEERLDGLLDSVADPGAAR